QEVEGHLEAEAKASGAAGDVLALRARIENRGGADWPALATPGASDDLLVGLVAHWQPPGEVPGPRDMTIHLPRAVAADDAVALEVPGALPASPGAWTLELGVVQVGVGAFANVTPALVRVAVRPSAR